MRAKTVNGGRVQFTVRLPPELYAYVIKQSEAQCRTKTGIVEMALREYLRNHGEDNAST